MGTVRSFKPWMGYPPQPHALPGQMEPPLAEFDWDSLRRWDEGEDEQQHARRAEQSLTRLNARLRARNLRRHLMPLLAMVLLPITGLLLARYAWRASCA